MVWGYVHEESRWMEIFVRLEMWQAVLRDYVEGTCIPMCCTWKGCSVGCMLIDVVLCTVVARQCNTDGDSMSVGTQVNIVAHTKAGTSRELALWHALSSSVCKPLCTVSAHTLQLICPAMQQSQHSDTDTEHSGA